MTEFVLVMVFLLWSWLMYVIGAENGEAKAINKSNDVDRFEVVDHRQCVYCRGRCTANYLQKDGSYKEQLCDKCDGSGMRGGRVFVASSNAETSNVKIQLSYQDDDKTLKVFVSDQ